MCSLLFVVDQNTGRIEEVGEGVDYGVRRRSTASPSKPGKKGEVLNEDEKFLKGVRICRDCRPVLLYVHDLSLYFYPLTLETADNSIDKRWELCLRSRDFTTYVCLSLIPRNIRADS